MASKTEMANLALAHCGVSKAIQDLDTENSKEAQACRLFFDTALKEMLRHIAWPFATRTVALALVEADPTQEWKYSYRYPSDCLMARRILGGTRNDNRQSAIPFRLVSDASGNLLYCDQPDALLEYTAYIDNVDRYHPDFIMAFSYRLAAYIAKLVTGGDPFKLGEQAAQFYRLSNSMASAHAFNEGQSDDFPDSEFERARV